MKIEVPVHSSIIINDEIYFDPYNLNGEFKKAKYIFITHSHYDHFSPNDIKKIANDKTIFIAPKDVSNKLKKLYPENTILEVKPNENHQIWNMSFSTFASYNKIKPFHPKLKGWVGYNVDIDNKKVLVCGDSDLTETLLSQKADVLFVPIGGTYTMDWKEGAKLTNTIKPEIVIPVHYGSIVGSKSDEEKFVNAVEKQIKVQICIK